MTKAETGQLSRAAADYTGRIVNIDERAAAKRNYGSVELPEPWRSSDVMVVLPTYQEVANLPMMVKMLMELPLPAMRVMIVDDNSPDGTGQVAEELADRYGRKRVIVVHRPGKEGLGKAYVDGMSRAIAEGAEFVIQMDSDLSHDPAYLPGMLGTMLSAQADVVVGSRYVVGASVGAEWPWHRVALSAFANAYVRALLHLDIRDVTAGYKLWRTSALEAIGLSNVRSNGYSFQVEMNYRARLLGLKMVELPIHFSERAAGESKMSLRVQLESAAMPFKLKNYSRRPWSTGGSADLNYPRGKVLQGEDPLAGAEGPVSRRQRATIDAD